MTYSRYTWWFLAAALALTITALATYREISAMSLATRQAPVQPKWVTDTSPAPLAPMTPVPSKKFSDVAAEDAAWRAANAKHYSVAELRARGDGSRTPRQKLQDRVFAATRAGHRERAIAELSVWVDDHPRDVEAILWLARLLNEGGRTKESIKLYRRALDIEGGRR